MVHRLRLPGPRGEREGIREKAERLIITGKLRIRDWETDDRKGADVEIEADAIGHDLSWGTTTYVRTPTQGVDTRVVSETTSPVPEPDKA
jgi:single-strand DNA-binding protein